MSAKYKSATMWAIYNARYGFYVGTQFTRHDMIQEHTTDLGKDWKYCRERGDSAVRVRITAIDDLEESKNDN